MELLTNPPPAFCTAVDSETNLINFARILSKSAHTTVGWFSDSSDSLGVGGLVDWVLCSCRLSFRSCECWHENSFGDVLQLRMVNRGKHGAAILKKVCEGFDVRLRKLQSQGLNRRL